MESGAPIWRQGYDAVEQVLEPRVMDLMRHRRFGWSVGFVLRLRGSAHGMASTSTRRLLHMLNLPAGTDVTRLLNEIGSVKRELHELSTHLERAQILTAELDSTNVEGSMNAAARPPHRRNSPSTRS
jgi:hypothetical protein